MKNMDMEKIKQGVRLILEGIGEDAAFGKAAGNAGAGRRHVRRSACRERARNPPIF